MYYNKVEICGVNTSTLKVLSDEEKRSLLLRTKQGDANARQELIYGNLRLVLSIIQRFVGRKESLDDLFQVGCIVLISAIDKFDLTFNVEFSTYAVPLILGEIKKFFRDEGCIKVSRGLKELHIKIVEFREKYLKDNYQEPRIEIIAENLGVSSQDIVLALESHYYPTSLSETIYEKEDSSIYLEDIIPQEEKYSKLDFICLEDGIERLTKKEKQLIYLRYYENYNQQEIAKKLNVSQVQVSRLEKKIIEKLRKQFV